MKSRKLRSGMLVITLVLGTILIGCPEPGESQPIPFYFYPSTPTYTVWTDSISHSEFTDAFPDITLNDGQYARGEFSPSNWSELSPSLTNEGKYNWTESEIKNWFIGRGFGNTEANENTAWLITINHGILFSRSGTIVDMILK